MGDDHLGFRPGQLVECRSFEEGFFGAWFRGTVSALVGSGDEPALRIRYLDFDDGNDHAIYAASPQAMEEHERKQLMVRPEYPPVCVKMEESNKEVFLLWNRDLEAGDSVEWWWNGAFWDCQILEVLDEESVQVSVPEPPFGVGGEYRVDKSFLRPGLSWWPEFGWVVKDPKPVPLVTVRYKERWTGCNAVSEVRMKKRNCPNENVKSAQGEMKFKLYRKTVKHAKLTALALQGGFFSRFGYKKA